MQTSFLIGEGRCPSAGLCHCPGQEIPAWLVGDAISGKAEIVIKSRLLLATCGLAQATPFWVCCLVFNKSHSFACANLSCESLCLPCPSSSSLQIFISYFLHLTHFISLFQSDLAGMAFVSLNSHGT